MRMDNNLKQFAELYKAVLWEDAAYLPGSVPDWGKLYMIACQQSLAGVVGDYLVRNSSRFSAAGFPIPEKLLARIKAVVFQIINANAKLNGVLAEVVSALRQAGVQSVLLKGQGVALNYPNPMLRQCGDIDLYVGQENYLKTADVLKDMAGSIEFGGGSAKHYHITVREILIEVHRTSMVYSGNKEKDAFFAALQSEGLALENVTSFEVNGTEVHTPDDQFNAVYIFNHLFHHFMTGGIGLRQISDWMYFIRSHRTDSEMVLRSLEGLNEVLPWKVFASLAVDVFRFPAEEMPLYCPGYSEKAKTVLKTVFDEGNFGKNKWAVSHRSKYYLVAKTQSFVRAIGRYFVLVTVFPSITMDAVKDFLVSGFSAVWDDFKAKLS